MENKNGSYECQYNPTGFDRIPKPDLNANSFLSSHRENVKFQFNQFFCPLVEQYYEIYFRVAVVQNKKKMERKKQKLQIPK